MSSTRKIRLSQKLTLSFRDISMPGADGNVAELVNQGTDDGSSDETFDSLPDLLPYIFQSQEKPSAPDLPYVVADCSTYKLWESTTDVIPLASQIEEAEHLLLTGTHNSGADNLQSNDSGSALAIPTRIGVRENLRRVQAFSPHTSILYSVLDISRSEDLRNAHADVTCDAAMEVERQPDASLDIGGDTDGSICADCYLILDEDTTKESPFDESAVADTVTCDAAIEFELRKPDALDIGGYTDGILAVDCYVNLEGNMMKESPFEESVVADETVENSILSSISQVRPDGQEEDVGKQTEVKKRTMRRKSPFQASSYYSLDFPKHFRKQKRSTAPRRREGPSASIDLVHKTIWLSNTGIKQNHLERDQGAQETGNLPVKKETRTSQTRKTKRKTVPVSSVRKLFSESPANQSEKLQPSGRRGKKRNSHPDQKPA